ncbi:hypothetical protein AWRIB429_0823 [Oenococcus oeni AWRIB429]|uniref:Uncharacterized protein n=1 Tax=Oenococcus oeni AWRIB429 TaxID=655225 RepID=D3L8Z3_OENOE|nr:hypothetical protein AWRIB429_0823 [Oenococcus oeni AWRIB429]
MVFFKISPNTDIGSLWEKILLDEELLLNASRRNITILKSQD